MDPNIKRQVLRTFTYGLYVVSCADEGEINAFTANWLSQASFDPPLLMISVENASKSLPMILRSRVFTVNVLRSGSRALAGKLGKSAVRDPGKLAGIEYEICLAQELPQLTGGKSSLLKFFKYLKRVSSLLDDFKGEKTAGFFYLDKDIDDILKACNNSEHIVYTEHYSFENYLFQHGDLVEATAAAASLDLASVRRVLDTDKTSWRRRARVVKYLDYSLEPGGFRVSPS